VLLVSRARIKAFSASVAKRAVTDASSMRII